MRITTAICICSIWLQESKEKNKNRLVNWTASAVLVATKKREASFQDIYREVSSGKDSLWKPSSKELAAVLFPYFFRCICSSKRCKGGLQWQSRTWKDC